MLALATALLTIDLANPMSAMTLSNSYWKRRLYRHAAILLFTLATTTLFWVLFRDRRDLISHLSIATAYPALFLTAAALLIGPWNVLTMRPHPISFDLRRDLGIWAGLIAIAHTAVGLNVHLRGRPWLYFVDQHGRLRRDLFGFSNYTGAIAALVFLLLLAISNDLSLRKLGTARWKFIQRWTYAAAALTIAHAIAFQQVEKRKVPYETVVWVTALAVCGLQIAGWSKRARQSSAPPRPP